MPQDPRASPPQDAVLDNPVAQTPTRPPTVAPIVGQGPVTQSAPLNMVLGSSVVGATQAGFAAVTGDGWVLATSVFLNLIAQIVKVPRWVDEHKLLIVIMLIVSFVVSYFIAFPGDVPESFRNMANSTMQAIVNYKGDKAAGLNIMPPAPDANTGYVARATRTIRRALP